MRQPAGRVREVGATVAFVGLAFSLLVLVAVTATAPSGRAQPAPAPAATDRVVGLTAGDGQVCAWTERGRIFCWGRDRYGGVGAASETCATGEACATGPVEVPVRDVVEAVATLDGTCARRRDGSVVCWGLLVGGAPRVTSITSTRGLEARERGVCAVGSRGANACIGGELDAQRTPAPDVALPRGMSRPRGPGSHACAIVDARLLCWGSCSGGPCGPTLTTMIATPTLVEGLEDVRAFALGNRFTCVLRGTGDVVCFGDDRHGALGDGIASRATGLVHVAIPLESSPPPEHIEPRDETPPILHVCDAAAPGVPLTTLAIRAFERGGAAVDVYLAHAHGNLATIARDARAADPRRCATLLQLLAAGQ
jgi:hypothetical protein